MQKLMTDVRSKLLWHQK